MHFGRNNKRQAIIWANKEAQDSAFSYFGLFFRTGVSRSTEYMEDWIKFIPIRLHVAIFSFLCLSLCEECLIIARAPVLLCNVNVVIRCCYRRTFRKIELSLKLLVIWLNASPLLVLDARKISDFRRIVESVAQCKFVVAAVLAAMMIMIMYLALQYSSW